MQNNLIDDVGFCEIRPAGTLDGSGEKGLLRFLPPERRIAIEQSETPVAGDLLGHLVGEHNHSPGIDQHDAEVDEIEKCLDRDLARGHGGVPDARTYPST